MRELFNLGSCRCLNENIIIILKTNRSRSLTTELCLVLFLKHIVLKLLIKN